MTAIEFAVFSSPFLLHSEYSKLKKLRLSFLIKVELEGVMKERKVQLRHSGDNRVYRGGHAQGDNISRYLRVQNNDRDL